MEIFQLWLFDRKAGLNSSLILCALPPAVVVLGKKKKVTVCR